MPPDLASRVCPRRVSATLVGAQGGGGNHPPSNKLGVGRFLLVSAVSANFSLWPALVARGERGIRRPPSGLVAARVLLSWRDCAAPDGGSPGLLRLCLFLRPAMVASGGGGGRRGLAKALLSLSAGAASASLESSTKTLPTRPAVEARWWSRVDRW
jgi:hypothetical protein